MIAWLASISTWLWYSLHKMSGLFLDWHRTTNVAYCDFCCNWTINLYDLSLNTIVIGMITRAPNIFCVFWNKTLLDLSYHSTKKKKWAGQPKIVMQLSSINLLPNLTINSVWKTNMIKSCDGQKLQPGCPTTIFP